MDKGVLLWFWGSILGVLLLVRYVLWHWGSYCVLLWLLLASRSSRLGKRWLQIAGTVLPIGSFVPRDRLFEGDRPSICFG